MRIGPSMSRAVAHVTHHPGCVMRDAAIAAHRAATGRNNAFGYNPVHRAIRAGLIVRRANPARRGTWLLYPSQAD